VAYAKEYASKHGMSFSDTYKSWAAMKRRWRHRERYAQLGVCERWLVFTNFLEDMGERPAGRTIERIDNAKGYEPGNCRWATKVEQQRNRSNTKFLTFNGKTQSLPDWADEMGLHKETIRHRMQYYGWSVERALTTPAIVGTNQWKGGA
jgi:hypothetical protein